VCLRSPRRKERASKEAKDALRLGAPLQAPGASPHLSQPRSGGDARVRIERFDLQRVGRVLNSYAAPPHARSRPLLDRADLDNLGPATHLLVDKRAKLIRRGREGLRADRVNADASECFGHSYLRLYRTAEVALSV